MQERAKPTPNFKIGFVLVAYDSGDLLKAAVSSISRTFVGGNRFTTYTVVIDNHPWRLDHGVELLVDKYISMPSNPGFGAACNAGIDVIHNLAEFDFVMLLNPDAELSENFALNLINFLDSENYRPGAPISPLLLFSQEFTAVSASEALGLKKGEFIEVFDLQEGIEIFSNSGEKKYSSNNPKFMLHSDDLIVFSSNKKFYNLNGRFNSFDNAQPISNYEINSNRYSEFRKINNAGSFIVPPYKVGDSLFGHLFFKENWLNPIESTLWCGAAVLLPLTYFKKVGLFDERFFLYYEDSDLALRGTRKGLNPTLVSNLIVYHQHSASTGKNMKKRNGQIWKSRSLFVSKNYGFRYVFILLINLIARSEIKKLNKSALKHFVVVQWPEIKNTFEGMLLYFTKRSMKLLK